jgi:hypothetical protein
MSRARTIANFGDGIASADIGDGQITAGKLNSTLDLSGKSITLPAGTGGKVLQIVTVNSTNQQSFSSTSFGATDLSVAITPSSTSSKILAIGTTSLRNNTNGFTAITLYRDSTNLGPGNGMAYSKDFGTQWRGSAAFNYLDSPSTTSSITYSIRCRIQESGHTGYVNAEGAQGTLTLLEIAG